MSKAVQTLFGAVAALCLAGAAQAQSTSSETVETTTTTSQDGDTTRTQTRTVTRSTTVDVDGEGLVDALAGALLGEGDGGRRGGRLTSESASGEWRMIETTNTGHRRECTLTLTDQPAFGRLRATTRSCFGPLFGVIGWRVEGGRVALYRGGGVLVALLRGDPERLRGQDDDGEDVRLYRQQ